MPTIELPKFGTAQSNENEPTDTLKSTGWANGDKPPASVLNWLQRSAYDSIRATLARTVAGSVAQGFAVGANLATVTNMSNLHVDPVSGIVLAHGYTAGGNNIIFKSTDTCATSTTVLDDTRAESDLLAIVPGEYAVLLSTTGFYYASTPFTSWTYVAKTFGTGIFESFAIADVTGLGSVLMCLDNDGLIWYTDATTVPTVSGDWTSSDVSVTVGVNCREIAASATSVVVGTSTGVFEAATADGISSGDFSAVSGPTDCDGLDFNGEVFATVDGSGPTILSTADDDASGTWSAAFVDDSTNISSVTSHIWGDTTSGLFIMTTLNGSTESVFVSTDGRFWYEIFSHATTIKADYSNISVKIHPKTFKAVAISNSSDFAVSL